MVLGYERLLDLVVKGNSVTLKTTSNNRAGIFESAIFEEIG